MGRSRLMTWSELQTIRGCATNGWSIPEIADHINRSPKTVRTFCSTNNVICRPHRADRDRDGALNMRSIRALVKDKMPSWVWFGMADGGRKYKDSAALKGERNDR